MSTVTDAPKLASMNLTKVRSVGNGAGSTIYLVQENPGGRKFALKVVERASEDDDIYIKQAHHEFKVARMLDHPAILKVYDLRAHRKWLKVRSVELLMEFVNGKVLDELKSPSVGILTQVFSRVAAAMVHMHRRGIYHGDLKPGNIMVSRSGDVKVIDFGTAWIRGEDKNRVQGTLYYMAPEQARNKVVDERTDLYNFGATMYRMFTGEYANIGIPSLDDGRIGRSRLRSPSELNPDVPGTLNEAIMRCLEPNPDKRPAGMFEVQHQLDAVLRYLGLEHAELEGVHD